MELIDRISKAELAERQQISRRNITEHLQLLSSVKEQLEYQDNVPHVNIAVELVCMWFDDSYDPKDKIFLSGFSERELEAMSEFSEIFEQVLAPIRGEQFPETADLVKMPDWTRLTQAAQSALRVFEPNAGK